MRNFLKILSVDKDAMMPLYHQIFHAIKQGVEDGMVQQGDLLPSINDLCLALDISKNTSEKAYNLLKKHGFLESVPGKGYFIRNPGVQVRKKVLLLFNKISAHKKIIYDSFVKAMQHSATIDLCIYHNDVIELNQLLQEKLPCYHTFVIIPPFIKNDALICELLSHIPAAQLYIMDRYLDCAHLYHGAVYQDFEKDIYTALGILSDRLKKYERLKIVFPHDTTHAVEILSGFRKFCRKNVICFQIITDVEQEQIVAGTAYVSLMEDDLVVLIEKIQLSGLRPGTDIGLISYNETPLKKMLLNGITTVSTDFKWMGEKMAELVLARRKEQVPVPFHVICRNSV